MERTPGIATLTYWVVGPLHSYMQEGWVDKEEEVQPYRKMDYKLILLVLLGQCHARILDNKILPMTTRTANTHISYMHQQDKCWNQQKTKDRHTAGSNRHSLGVVDLSYGRLLCKLCQTHAMWPQFTDFFGKPAMRTRWMVGTAAHKSSWCLH